MLTLAKRAALAFLCFPNILVGWLFAATVQILWGESMRWHGLVLVTTLKENSWPLRTWWKGWAGFSSGHGIMLAPGWDLVLPHELEHTEQVQAGSVAGLVVGIAAAACGSPLLGALVWTMLPLLNYGAGAAVAVLRGKRGYYDNLFERAARDATKV